MKYQQFPWSCGSASVVNALRRYGIHISESRVIPISKTTSPTKCAHCRKIKRLEAEHSCTLNCELCRDIKRLKRGDCAAGTDEKGILTAIRHFGGDLLTASEYSSGSRDNAWQWLHGTLVHGRVAILCISSWEHWVTAFGTSGDVVNLFDSWTSKANMSENGLHTWGKTELMQKWWNARKSVGKEKRLYAISVGKK